MRRWGVAAGVATLLVGALLFMRPFATRERDVIASTPAAAGAFNPLIPIEMGPNAQLCVVRIPLDSESKVARVFVYTFGKPGAPLEVELAGRNGYRYDGRFPGGYPEGPVDLPLRPPAHSTDGQICVRNKGTTKIGIQATQVGQRFSAPQPFLNGGGLEQDVPMTLLEPGQKTFIQQVPRAIERAAVFVPLAPWALWILLALALVGIPAGVLLALARAGAAQPAGGADAGVAAPPVPLPRARAAVGRGAAATLATARRVPPLAWLGLLLVVTLAFTYVWSSRMGTFQNDENQYVYLARWTSHNLPSSLWNFDLLGRGLQRLEIWVLALTLGTMKPPGAFLVAHLVNVTAYVSAAIPMYLLVRGLGARWGWALLAALLAVTGPWLVFSVTFLTEPLAYPAFVWLMWATWRAVVEPRLRTQLLAFAMLFVALLTRSAFLILVPLLPIVVLAQELRYDRWTGGAAAMTRRLWERYAVVVALVALGVFGLLLSVAGVLPAPGKLAGGYGTPFSVVWGPFLDKTALYASRVVAGTGFVPFAIGLPWLVVQLFRPDDRRTHAFVVTAVAAIVLIVYASSPAGPDERYVIYFAPPLIVAMTLALSRRRLGWGWVAAGGALGALLLYKHGWNPDGGAYGFFVGPAETFYARVGLLHLQDYVPAGLTLPKAAFVVALGASAVCAYAVSRGRHATRVMICLVAFLALLQVAQGYYNTSKFVTQGGERFGPSHEQRTWVDQAIYGKATAAIIGLGQGNTTGFNPAWTEIEFWNSSVTSEFAPAPLQIQLPPGDYPGLISTDDRTGRMRSEPPLPPYAVIPRGYVDLGMAGPPVAHASYLAADLVHLSQPLQARFRVAGPTADGYIEPRKQTTVRFFAAGLDSAARWCGVVPLSAPVGPSGDKETIPYRLGDTRGSVRGGSLVNAQTPLEFGGKPYADITLTGEKGVKLQDKRVFSLQLGQISVKRC